MERIIKSESNSGSWKEKLSILAFTSVSSEPSAHSEGKLFIGNFEKVCGKWKCLIKLVTNEFACNDW